MDIKLQAPITVQMEISIINDETGQQGTATVSMSKGRYHDEQSQRDQLDEFVKDHIPDGFRLMTKREWFNSQFGQCHDEDDMDGNPQYINYAMPGGNDWQD